MAEQNNAPTGGQQVQVKVSDEVLRGTYATQALVSHSSEEFVLDFINHLPPAPLLTSRVIVSPAHFKRLVRAMEENLKNYETEFGTINLSTIPDQKIGFKTE